MPVLVTGRSGFVGSHLADTMETVPLELAGHFVDITEPQAVLEALLATTPEAVVHLAAQSAVPAAIADPMQTYRVNVLGTLNLLQALRATGFRGRMLYVSSGDVYGSVVEEQLPIDEQIDPQPRNPYAASKLAAEALCLQWARTCPLDIVIARPFNHIGPRQDARFAVADFARQAVRIRQGHAKPELQVGDIDATRDFTDVRDIVRAYGALLTHGRPGEVYNVCSNLERSLRSVIETLSEVAGLPLQCKVQAERLRAAEQRRVRGSFDKLHAHTGWAPSIPLRDTLADIMSYWEEIEIK